ncbi:hypothetical protein [Methylocucumis oryzae]|uniref:hypothetical protein n=1 Tax=Methylocucumis oryzae TaxID=1632867 RepID=UPI000695CC28|nr:hypothetical protein [Methylocucumis oryzae]
MPRYKKKSLVPDDDNDMNRIFAILRDKCKIDFTFYKPNTVVRRIERRITINQLRDLQEYLLFLQNNSNEIYVLYQELLIGVTSFFRDEHVFEEIKEKWLEQLETLAQGEELRVLGNGLLNR